MNLLLYASSELEEGTRLILTDRRLKHLLTVIRPNVGDCLRVGEINGRLGEGHVEAISKDRAILRVTSDTRAPPALDVSVVLALPRPKALRRVLRDIAELGVKDIHLIHCYRVEKSYWQSPLVHDDAMQLALQEGLEQSVDTVLPKVTKHQRFKPFAQDVLPILCKGRRALLAHPYAEQAFPRLPRAPALLLVGPEGGFIPFENTLLCAAGAEEVTLGPRILKVETAMLYCLSAFALGAA